MIDPNGPGIISPFAKCKIGIMPGDVGVISRSGTLAYEVVNQLTRQDIGHSMCIGIGGDPLPGTNFVKLLELFQQDDQACNCLHCW